MQRRIPLIFHFTLILLIVVGCSDEMTSTDEEEQGNEMLPDEMTWSVYEVGSSGNADMTGIADALLTNYDTQIRMLPSSGGAGRMFPLRDGEAQIGKLGDEVQFAFEGIEEFSRQNWGPQNVRAIWAPVNQYGLVVREDSDIETIEDVEGMRVPYIVGNPSLNIKVEAMLAFAGLTFDDVTPVEFSSYADSATGFDQGQIDVLGSVPSASALIEVESETEIQWLEMDPNDTEGWDRVEEVASWLFPETSDDEVGMDGDTTIIGHGYLIAGYADQDPEFIYNFVRALDESYEQYGSVTSNLEQHSKEDVLNEPLGIPFHEGTVEFLEEEGLWDEEKQQENDDLINRYDELSDAWDQVIDEADDEAISEDEFPAFWLDRKEELVE